MFSIFKFKKISTVKRNEQHWFDLSDDRFFNGINREALIEFKKRIEHYATSTDIQSYIAQFHNLPEFKHKTEKTSLESLTPQAQSFLLEIEKLEMQSPFAALKLLVLLCCDEKVSFYKNHFILIEMIKRIQHGMTNDQIPCQDRLDFGFVCYQNWPLTGYYHAHQQQRNIQFSNKIFEEPLSISLIDYAQKSPDEALALFDKQFQPERSGFFLLAENDSYYFLKFIELLKNKRPKLYQDALLGYLSYTNLGEPIAPTKGDINEVLAQLYEILIDDQSPYHVDREKICKGLILYATPDQPWYSQLSQTLWDIEQQKIASDTLSIDNLFIAAMNAAEGAIFLDEICNCYKKWAKSYLNFSQDEFRPYLEHAKKILGKINLSLNKEYLGYHNSPPLLRKKTMLIDVAVNSYWEMTKWLFIENKKLYFYVLAVAIAKDHITCEVTDKIADEAKIQILNHFETFLKNDAQGCIEVVAYIIRQTQFSNYTKQLSPFLDELFPLFLKINTDAARISLEKGLDFERYDRQPVWEPRDLQTNPLYEEVNIRPVIFV